MLASQTANCPTKESSSSSTSTAKMRDKETSSTVFGLLFYSEPDWEGPYGGSQGHPFVDFARWPQRMKLHRPPKRTTANHSP